MRGCSLFRLPLRFCFYYADYLCRINSAWIKCVVHAFISFMRVLFVIFHRYIRIHATGYIKQFFFGNSFNFSAISCKSITFSYLHHEVFHFYHLTKYLLMRLLYIAKRVLSTIYFIIFLYIASFYGNIFLKGG